MKILIAISSKARPYKQKTLGWLKECNLGENVDYRVFVEPHEKQHYKVTVPKGKLVVIDANDKGLGYVRMKSHLYAQQKGYDLIFQLDDDINAFIDERAKTIHKKEVFENILNDVPQLFEKEPDLGLVRFISARGFYFYKNLKQQVLFKNQGAWGCVISRINPEHYSEYVSAYEDTYACLNLWKDGKYTYTYGLAGINVEVYTNDGGMQCFDRKQESINAIEFIKTKFPDVSFVDANNTLGYDIDISAYKPKEEKLF